MSQSNEASWHNGIRWTSLRVVSSGIGMVPKPLNGFGNRHRAFSEFFKTHRNACNEVKSCTNFHSKIY